MILIKFRHLILFSLAATQILSSVFFVPGGEGVGGSVFRFLLVVTSGSLMLSSGFHLVSDSTRKALLAGGLLVAWMVLSLGWSNDIMGGFRQVSYVVTILLLIYVLEALIRNRQDYYFLAKAIVLWGCVVVAFAFYELQTGNHFHSSLSEVALYDSSLSYITADLAWATFGNPNDLSVHLIFCCAVVFLYYRGFNGTSVLPLIFVCICVYLADRLGARLAVLSLLVFVAVYLISLRRRRANFGTFAAVSTNAVAILALTLGLILVDRTEFIDRSSFIRLQLISNSLAMSAQTLLIGVGTGGFESEMIVDGLTSLTYGIVNPHNAFARMMAENGALGLTLLGFLIFGPLAVLLRAGQTTRLSAWVGASVAILPLLLSVGSDPLSSSSLQFFIAFVWIGCRFVSDPSSKNVSAAADF